VNRGFAAACNIGAVRAQGRSILFLNPDAELLPGTLPQLADHLEADAKCAAVGPSLIYPDGTPQDSAFSYPSLLMTWLEFFPKPARLLHTRANGRLDSKDGRPIPITHPLGACMLVRRGAWTDVGPFDEGFFLYCEEVDWCVRARDKGWTIVHVPAAKALHHEGRSAATARAASIARLYESRGRLHRKHRGRLFQGMARFITTVGLARERSRLQRAAANVMPSPDVRERIDGIERVLQRQK
jgi:GT2 family glycosyltransferase